MKIIQSWFALKCQMKFDSRGWIVQRTHRNESIYYVYSVIALDIEYLLNLAWNQLRYGMTFSDFLCSFDLTSSTAFPFVSTACCQRILCVSLYSATRMCDPTARCARENEIFSKPHSMLDTLSPHVIYQIYWQHALATDKSQFTDRIFGHGPLNSIVIVRSVWLVRQSPLRSSISLLRWHMRVLLLENNSHHRTILNVSRSHRKELAAFGLGLFDTDLISISRMIL